MKRILTALLAIAVILAPQYSAIIPAKFELYFYLLLGVYEVVARLIPTVKDISLLSQLIKVIQLLFPNYSAEQKTVVKDTHE